MRCPPSLLAAWLALLALACLAAPHAAQAAVVIVAHPTVRKLDTAQVQRIYTGRVVELAGQALQPVNYQPGSPTRQRFLNEFLQQDEERYTAYWTVRRYVGKGVPPRELNTLSEVIAYINSTPGAIAYLEEAEVPQGMNIVAGRPAAAPGLR
jgi:ABC-type phosphate transport system substrate-binding protein